tara:strand:- start:6006 stop:8360 length:2355 start_codon:yes stop_codon:yes gene_type:complete
MAKVPLTPQEGLEIGSAPQFSATTIQPVQDTVTDDLVNFSKAQNAVSAIAFKLQDEYNDAESKKLYNEFYSELETNTNNYLNTQGFDAVKVVDKENNETAYDQTNNSITDLLASYSDRASNGEIKYMFENMALVSVRSAQNKMTNHSIKQQRLAHEAEVTASITNKKTAAMQNYETWQDPTGDFVLNYTAGLELLKEQAVLKGWNIDPNAVDPTGKKIPVSSQFIESVNEYNMEILKDLIKQLDADGKYDQISAVLEKFKPIMKEEDFANISISVKEKYDDYNSEKIVDTILFNNGNQNSGNYLDQAEKVFSLNSSNNSSNDIGGSVKDGFNTNDELLDTTNNERNENIELLEQIKNTSKFYNPETTTRLIPEHQTTHLFAIQKLGVKKADAFYTKAKSQIDIDTKKYKEDPIYAKKINEQIIDNYNKLITEEVNKIYGRFGEGEFAITISNDLEVIKKGINYDSSVTENIDQITNLRPLNVLKEELKSTITNPKQLKYALQDLEIKYNKIKNERENAYNQVLNNAKEIAFAEPGGWKNLKANGIDIDNFTKQDQEILKNGQPEESDIDTVVELVNNPAEIATNLNAYSDKLDNGQYLSLKRYAASLRSEDSVVEATGNVTMLKATLDRYDMGDLYTSKNKNKKRKYVAIHDAWLKEINARQIAKGNEKLTMGEKQAALNDILLDVVNVDNDPFLGFIGGGDTKDTNIFFVDQDRLQDVYVDIPYNDENVRVFTSKIDPQVLSLITESLRKANKPVTQKNIADYFVRKGQPKNVNEAFAYREEE